MRAWFSKNGLQLLVIVLSIIVACGIKFDPSHLNAYLGILSLCGAVGIKLMPFEPFTSQAQSDVKVLTQMQDKLDAKKKDDRDNNDLPPPPALMAFAFAVMLFTVGVLQACTPAEQQAGAKFVADAATCIEQNAVPGADPKTVAAICGVAAIPDVLNVISSVIMSKQAQAGMLKCTNIVVDAGAPDGAGK